MAFLEPIIAAAAEGGAAEGAAAGAEGAETAAAGEEAGQSRNLAPEQFSSHKGGSSRTSVQTSDRDFNNPGYVS